MLHEQRQLLNCAVSALALKISECQMGDPDIRRVQRGVKATAIAKTRRRASLAFRYLAARAQPRGGIPRPKTKGRGRLANGLEPGWLEPPDSKANRQIGAVIFAEGAWGGEAFETNSKGRGGTNQGLSRPTGGGPASLMSRAAAGCAGLRRSL
jgi:hypothetical protein